MSAEQDGRVAVSARLLADLVTALRTIRAKAENVAWGESDGPNCAAYRLGECSGIATLLLCKMGETL